MKKIIKELFERLLHGNLDIVNIDGYKKYIGLLLTLGAYFIPGFPKFDVAHLDAGHLLLIWGAISDYYKEHVKK